MIKRGQLYRTDTGLYIEVMQAPKGYEEVYIRTIYNGRILPATRRLLEQFCDLIGNNYNEKERGH